MDFPTEKYFLELSPLFNNNCGCSCYKIACRTNGHHISYDLLARLSLRLYIRYIFIYKYLRFYNLFPFVRYINRSFYFDKINKSNSFKNITIESES